MLSTQLKSSSSDEKASDKVQLVDPLNSHLDDDKNSHPPSKFSLRDYVLDTRSKDIKKNWPFSQENLQLCLKHGVTDVLPPFQSPDTVRNPSVKSCSSYGALNDKKNICNLNGNPSPQSDDVFVDSENVECNPKIAVDCLNTKTSKSEGEKEFPSTITSHSCSDIDSVPIDKSLIQESETDILPELSVAKTKALSTASNKKENTTRAPVKKCRLIVKLSNTANSSTKEDTAANTSVVSEAMTSKVCPVCKTFSFSSNTTLNAHIDQCLSTESTSKWTTNSMVSKHRIKPRKMKSMVEIYATAPHCTLEELDRRNGTSWATNSSLPAQETETAADQKREGSCLPNPEETSNEGAVYIDANGTKLRILSKSNDSSLFSKVVDGYRPKKLMNRDKVSKFLSAKKRKKQNQVKKHQKLLKCGKKICSAEINVNQDRNFSRDETIEKERCMTQQCKAQAQDEFSRPDMMRKWACSKRTGLTKKINCREDHQDSGNYDNGDLGVENDQFSLNNYHLRKSCGRRSLNIFENALSSPGSSKRIVNSSYDPHDKFREQLPLRKRVTLSSVESIASHDRKSQVSLGFPGHKVKRSRSDEPPNQEDDASFQRKRKVKMNSSLDRNPYLVIDPKLSPGHRTLLSRARKLSLRKKLSSGRASVPDSKFNLKRKCSVSKNSRVHCISESNEEAVSGVDQQHLKRNTGDCGRMQRTCDIGSLDRTESLQTKRSGEGVLISRDEEAMALKASHSVSKPFHYDCGNYNGSFVLGCISSCRSDVGESAEKDVHTREKDLDVEPPLFTDFRDSSDTDFHELAGASDSHNGSQQFIEVYEEPSFFEAEAPRVSAEPSLTGGQEMYRAAEVPQNMIRETVHVLAEQDISDGHGNYFIEVDQIPIPGPPGSFLPSPGHMGSEDLRGNSSLNSSRVQSSYDHQELVDPLSESPISAISTISNSCFARFDSKSSGKLSVGYPVPDELRSGFIAAANDELVVENPLRVLKATNAGVEKISPDELKLNSTVTEKGVFGFKSDQPCCCSRKEGFSQNVSLNYQESQLSRGNNMAAVVVPASGKALTGDINRRLDRQRSEMSSISGQSPGSETAIRSPVGHTPSRTSADSDVKFSSCDDYESNSPPASNPVLRLMGKNLMVVKKDEYVCPQIKAFSGSRIDLANPQVVPGSGFSIGNVQNGNQYSSHHMVSQAPFCFDQTQSSKPGQHFEMRWSDGLGSCENHGTHQMSSLASPEMLSSRGAIIGFMGPLMHHEYIAGCSFPNEQHQPLKKGLGPSITCDVDKVVKIPSL